MPHAKLTLTGSTAVMFNADCRTTFSLPTIQFNTTAKTFKQDSYFFK